MKVGREMWVQKTYKFTETHHPDSDYTPFNDITYVDWGKRSEVYNLTDAEAIIFELGARTRQNEIYQGYI